jgi:hypothetical protein
MAAKAELDNSARTRPELPPGRNQHRDAPTRPRREDSGADAGERLRHVATVDDVEFERSRGAASQNAEPA